MGEGWQKQNIMEVPKRRVISHNRETPVDEMGKQTDRTREDSKKEETCQGREKQNFQDGTTKLS